MCLYSVFIRRIYIWKLRYVVKLSVLVKLNNLIRLFMGNERSNEKDINPFSI